MEIVNFSDREFKDIPQQDNPAFDKHECMLICKTGKREQDGAKFLVIHIIPVTDPYKEDSVHRKAKFWNEEDAIDFAQHFSQQSKQDTRSADELIAMLQKELERIASLKIVSRADYDMKTDYSKALDALIGNPNTEDGDYMHGKPIIYALAQSHSGVEGVDYRKVKCEDGLPTERGYYDTDKGNLLFIPKEADLEGGFGDGDVYIDNIEYWFEEIV